jgi:hypothetical protein
MTPRAVRRRNLALIRRRRDVALLWDAIVAAGNGDRAGVAEAEAALLELAQAGGPDFAEELIGTVADMLARSLPGATREQAEQAVRVDVKRHLTWPMRLARAEPWGHA